MAFNSILFNLPFPGDSYGANLYKDPLSSSVANFWRSSTQREDTLAKKLRLRDILFYPLSQIFPVCGLYVVGSSLNGFGNESSDMDLCLVITANELDQNTEALTVLKLVQSTLSTLGSVKEQTLIKAKVPILRIRFNGVFSEIIVDINANNSVAIRNTHLLSYYAFFDWRVRPIVSVVKEWAKQCGINDASRSSFTSYSLVLMVIHYLQVGVELPVLPSLQKLYPKVFHASSDVRFLNLTKKLDLLHHEPFDGKNTSTLGALLIGFFHYFAHTYDYDNNAISVRLGCKVTRKEVLKDARQWSQILIEEPFTQYNTAHSIYDERVFAYIKMKFCEAYETLNDASDVTVIFSQSPVQISSSMSNNSASTSS